MATFVFFIEALLFYFMAKIRYNKKYFLRPKLIEKAVLNISMRSNIIVKIKLQPNSIVHWLNSWKLVESYLGKFIGISQNRKN